MIVYTIIMLLTALLFGLVSRRIYRGDTELIHDYHRARVKDQAGYGKAFGKAMAVMALGMLLSGVIALFGEKLMWLSLTVLLIGLAGGILAIILVQRKYNGGVFS